MQLNTILRGAPLALVVLTIGLFAMNKKQPLEEGAPSNPAKAARTGVLMVKLLTSDEQVIDIPEDLALQSSVIRNMIADLEESDEPIPLPNVTKATLDLIIEILQAIKDAPDQVKFKRLDDKYIAQRIQPLIDQKLGSVDNINIAHLIVATEYLELEQIVNGAIRALVQKTLDIFPMATIASIKSIWSSNNIIWADRLNSILEYQYQLVKNGNIPELSVADYIAMKGMPRIAAGSPLNRMSLFLEKSNLTSLYGLDQISTRTTIECAYLQRNKLTTLPREGIFNGFVALKQIFLEHNMLTELPPTSFNGLTNLRELHLTDNRLTTLPAGIFNPLGNLTFLDLQRNTIATLPQGIFTPLAQLAFFSIKQNSITITNEQLRTEYGVAAITKIF